MHLTLTGTLRLADALSQLHVLLPVLDESKHYWQGPDEVDKLLRSGEGWLATHPDRELITRRYPAKRLSRVRSTRLAELGDDLPVTTLRDAGAHRRCRDRPSGHARSASATMPCSQSCVDLGATSVIDLGCGRARSRPAGADAHVHPGRRQRRVTRSLQIAAKRCTSTR